MTVTEVLMYAEAGHWKVIEVHFGDKHHTFRIREGQDEIVVGRELINIGYSMLKGKIGIDK